MEIWLTRTMLAISVFPHYLKSFVFYLLEYSSHRILWLYQAILISHIAYVYSSAVLQWKFWNLLTTNNYTSQPEYTDYSCLITLNASMSSLSVGGQTKCTPSLLSTFYIMLTYATVDLPVWEKGVKNSKILMRERIVSTRPTFPF
jgi:hypothetical protein